MLNFPKPRGMARHWAIQTGPGRLEDAKVGRLSGRCQSSANNRPQPVVVYDRLGHNRWEECKGGVGVLSSLLGAVLQGGLHNC